MACIKVVGDRKTGLPSWVRRRLLVVTSCLLLITGLLVASCGTNSAGVTEDGGDDIDSTTSAVCATPTLTVTPASPVPSNATITLAASSTCGVGETSVFQFSKFREGADTTWQVIQPYGAASTATFDTTGQPAGKYWFLVEVRREEQPNRDAAKQTSYILVGSVCNALAVTRQTGDPPPVGTQVPVSASATCTGGTPQYQLGASPLRRSIHA
jgi:hypothetical protein